MMDNMPLIQSVERRIDTIVANQRVLIFGVHTVQGSLLLQLDLEAAYQLRDLLSDLPSPTTVEGAQSNGQTIDVR